MSAGETPTAMPWRAATKPAAQNKAAPAPQATPKKTGGPIEDPEGAGLGALTEFLAQIGDATGWTPYAACPHGTMAYGRMRAAHHRRAEFAHLKERTSWIAAGMSGGAPADRRNFCRCRTTRR